MYFLGLIYKFPKIFQHFFMSAYDYLLKLLLVGNSNTQKTSLLLRFTEKGAATTSFIKTIGIDFKIATIDVHGKKVKLQIWDTFGQERFRSITTAHYRGANGIVLVYNIYCRSSFNDLRMWMKEIKQQTDDIGLVLVAHNCETEGDTPREISEEEGRNYAESLGVQYFETCAQTGYNVDEVFHYLALSCLKKRGLFSTAKSARSAGP